MRINPVQDIYDPAKFAVNKPFSCGEMATSGNIPNPDDTTNNVSTAQYFNNYDISHHNEIWGSAFTGAYHGGFTWLTETSHRYPNSNPKPPGTPLGLSWRNLGEYFNFKNIFLQDIDLNGNIILNGAPTDYIRSTYHNFKPLNDFFEMAIDNGADLNVSWYYESLYDAQQGIECYYQTSFAKDYGFGWIHNINFYWQNKYYYKIDFGNQIPYYQLNTCSTPNINGGITLKNLTPGGNYSISPIMTRIVAVTPPNFPSPTTFQADVSGYITLDASILSYLGCDTMNADMAFFLQRLPNRPGTQIVTDLPDPERKILSLSILPNPNQGQFVLKLNSSKDYSDSPLKISVYDPAGRIVYHKFFSTGNMSVDLSNVSKGFYLLKAEQGNVNLFHKISIQ